MDSISFRCTSCKHALKIGADKAGRKIKCTKCGVELTVPRSNPEKDKAGPQLAPEAPPKPVEEEEEDDKKGYGLVIEPTADEDQKNKPKEKAKKEEKAAPLKRKFKTLSDPDLWDKVKGGLQVMMIGMHIWAGVVLVMALMVLLGIINGPDYAEVMENAMTVKTNTDAGEIVSADMPAFLIGVVTGRSFQGIGKVLYILAAVLALSQIIVMMTGYSMCLPIPDRFGTKGQLAALLTLGGLNFLLILVFKLLPALGILNYMLLPYALPEVALVDANMDRDPAVWVLWSGAPFWEMILSVLFVCSFYAEPVLVGVFIWSIGLTLREDPIIEKGQGLVNMALGLAFALIAFQLLSMAGTSGVALSVVRLLYAGWVGFTVMLVLRIPVVIQAGRAILQKYLDGAEIREEEDAEEDRKSKRKRKSKPAKDEDDDDDE